MLYGQTQEFYRSKLGQELTIQRGVGAIGDSYRPWAAESWTTDKRTPARFGKQGQAGRGIKYSILTAQVPYSGILMSYQAQKKYWNNNLQGKKEIVVLGGTLRNMTREDF